MTLGELVSLKGSLGALAKSLTVGALVRGELGQNKRGGKPKSASKKTKASGAVDTRTAAGRAAYDKAVLRAVSRYADPVGAEQLLQDLGGTGLQLRSSLKRLIGAKKVVRSGKARATVYQAK